LGKRQRGTKTDLAGAMKEAEMLEKVLLVAIRKFEEKTKFPLKVEKVDLFRTLGEVELKNLKIKVVLTGVDLSTKN